MELSFAFEKRLQKTYTSAASRQGGRATSADASHVSQHALLRLGQSRRYNFLLSQAAGFLIPNPKWVVSSAPDIFRAWFESQPSPGGCSSSGWVTVGLVFSREARAGLQQRGATLEGFFSIWRASRVWCHHPHLASSLLCCPSDICRGAPSLLAHPTPWGQSPCAAPGTGGFNSALHVSYSQRDMNSWATLLEMPLQSHRTSCSPLPGVPCHRWCPLPTPLPCSRRPGQQSRAKAIVQCRDPLCFIYMRHHLFYKLDYNLKWNTQGNIY